MWIPVYGPKNELFLWSPQPPMADAALKELLKARHKYNFDPQTEDDTVAMAV